MMKINIFDLNLAGYDTYWKYNICIDAGSRYRIMIPNHVLWAKKVMTKPRFKNICSTFRPELGRIDIKDKYPQLRFIINKLDKRINKPLYQISNLFLTKWVVNQLVHVSVINSYAMRCACVFYLPF